MTMNQKLMLTSGETPYGILLEPHALEQVHIYRTDDTSKRPPVLTITLENSHVETADLEAHKSMYAELSAGILHPCLAPSARDALTRARSILVTHLQNPIGTPICVTFSSQCLGLRIFGCEEVVLTVTPTSANSSADTLHIVPNDETWPGFTLARGQRNLGHLRTLPLEQEAARSSVLRGLLRLPSSAFASLTPSNRDIVNDCLKGIALALGSESESNPAHSAG